MPCPLMYHELETPSQVTCQLVAVRGRLQTSLQKVDGAVDVQAPEQLFLKPGMELSTKADTYSFGVVLWEVSLSCLSLICPEH